MKTNLADLDQLADNPQPDGTCTIAAEDLAALIEAVTAAGELEEAWAQNFVASGNLFAALPPEFVKLREALTRFDFGDAA